MARPAVAEGRRRLSTVLLLAGYPVSVVAGMRPLRTFRERRTGQFLALEASIAAVTAGLVLRRRPLPALANAAAGIGLATAWVVTGRMLRK